MLAISRLFLGATVLVAARVRPLAPQPYQNLAVFLLLGYIVHSLGLFIWLRVDPEPTSGFVLWGQISDVLWPILLVFFTDPPNSIFFIFFLFALIAAAFRYGFLETVAIAIISTVLFLLQALAVKYGPLRIHELLLTQVEPARVLLRSGYLLLTGFLLGVLAEEEKELRAEIAVVNRLLSTAQIGNRLADTVAEISAQVAGIFGSSQVYAVAYQSNTGRMFRWQLESSAELGVGTREIAPEEHATALMSAYPDCFYIKRTGESRCLIQALDDEGRVLASDELHHLTVPVAEAKSVLAVTIEFGREWTGRFVVINPEIGARGERELRFAQNVIRQVGPALYSVYLFRRLRSRVGAVERARVARELHDTAIQSLISIEMQVDVLRRRREVATEVEAELERIQGLLRQEVLNLRELMQSMKPVDIGPQHLLDFIGQLVERFGRDTGVSVRFVSELQEVRLSANACRELARIVQEGLVNIRKHSNAKAAMVRFGLQSGLWKLVIDDDGRGFPFAGRFTLAELDELRRGPAVIKERVRAIGGDMVIESTPGLGSRLEITLPQKGYEPYGK